MSKEKINTETKTEELLPSLDESFQNREEYIHALEMSVQLLQREVEHLRSLSRESSITNSVRDGKNVRVEIDFSICKTSAEVLELLHNYLTTKFGMIESNIFFFLNDRNMEPATDSDTDSSLTIHVDKFMEEGIIDWVVEKNEVTFIPNMNQSPEEIQTNFIFNPLNLRGNVLALFIAITTMNNSEFTQNDLLILSDITARATITLDNIRSKYEIEKMNENLNELNLQMLQSTKLSSIGEIAGSASQEIESPLKIISGNINLIESGVGNSEKRLEIIKDEIENIRKITNRLSNLSKSSIALKQDTIDIRGIMDEVLFFSSFQFQRDGIMIQKEYSDDHLMTSGIYTQLAQVFLNLLLYSRDTMPEGGNITIGIYNNKDENLLISISDDSRGLDTGSSEKLFDHLYTDDYKHGLRLSISKKIIQQHKGSISVFSEENKGTTFKIILPLSKK